jgi:hypothetical protein
METYDAHVIERIMYFADNPEICPNYLAHTRGPDGYIGWHEWAECMQKTHRQHRCPDCGLFAIWTPRREDEPLEMDDFSEYDIEI